MSDQQRWAMAENSRQLLVDRLGVSGPVIKEMTRCEDPAETAAFARRLGDEQLCELCLLSVFGYAMVVEGEAMKQKAADA